MVDLQGRLSNPPYDFGRAVKALQRMLVRPRQDQPGGQRVVQVQRRLKPAEVDELVLMYEAGSSVPVVAESFGINRETVSLHLQRRGVRRRANARKLGIEGAEVAVALYAAGNSLSTVGSHLGVDAATVRRELANAGVPIRKRPGWS